VNIFRRYSDDYSRFFSISYIFTEIIVQYQQNVGDYFYIITAFYFNKGIALL